MMLSCHAGSSHLNTLGKGAWAAPQGGHRTETPPDLPGAGGDQVLALGCGAWGMSHLSSISSKVHVSTLPSRGLLPNGTGQTLSPQWFAGPKVKEQGCGPWGGRGLSTH